MRRGGEQSRAESLRLNTKKCEMLGDLCLRYAIEGKQFLVSFSGLDRFAERLSKTWEVRQACGGRLPEPLADCRQKCGR
ncbi:hypothetical protein A7K72_02270 [Candidatus Methylacidiphilum fumarolicum]|nr:hypothetical protein A7K72_02270 [Candidatus Methylacidiphilum fumarolicum]TFE77399.1 hypothetical protein A7D33_04695 [Candidatus Methylacidiphilum fumarolicum]